MLAWIALLARADRAKDAEILILPHQIAVLQRQAKAPRVSWAGRAALAAVAGLLPSSHLRRLRLIISRELCCAGMPIWSASDGRTRAALSSGPGPRHQCARCCWRWRGITLAGVRSIHGELTGLRETVAPSLDTLERA